MVRNILKLAFAVIIVSTFSKCEFNLDDVTDSEIKPPDEQAPFLQMSLNGKNDTINIGWKTNFTYSFSGIKNKIISVTITFENKLVHNYIINNDQTFSFTLDPTSYPDGNYQLNIKIITSTGSGSIADNLLAEGYLYMIEWPVNIDKALPSRAYYAISAKQTDKGMELSWPSFNHANFISYEVYRKYSFIQPEAVSIATITNPLNNRFIDSTFWEGTNCMYYLRINTPAGPFNGEYIWGRPVLGKLQARFNADRTIDVSWDKAKNLESFGGYYVYTGSSTSNIIAESFITDPDQNYTKFNIGAFNNTLYIYLKFIPKGVSEPYFRYLGYKVIQIWIPKIVASYFVKNKDLILIPNAQIFWWGK